MERHHLRTSTNEALSFPSESGTARTTLDTSSVEKGLTDSWARKHTHYIDGWMLWPALL